MLRQVSLEADLTLQGCQARLRGIEARIGEVVDMLADDADAEGEEPAEKVTVVTANKRSRVPANSLVLASEGDDPPAGKELQIAGTGWIEGKKTVLKVYR